MIAALRWLVQIRDDEVGALLWSCLYFFSLLAANYVIRPLRDEMGIAGGTRYLPGLFAGTLAAMVLANHLFALAVGRQPRRRFIPLLYRVIQASLLAFFALSRLVSPAGMVSVARGFFVWASVSNLFIVSVVWGSLADRFTSDQARRLFGFIGAGGTLGAIAGSALTAALTHRVGPQNLLLVAVALFELGLLAARRLLHPADPPRPEDQPAAEPGPQGDGVLGAMRRAVASPYLLGLSLCMLLFTTSSALVYLEQARIVDATFGDAADRTAFFARIDLLVNLAGLVVQTLLTGRIIAAVGVGPAAALLPAVTLGGVLVLAARPALTTLMWFQVLRRGVDYAVARPSREVMYTVVGRADKYQAKSFIDTAVYRLGDALGAFAYGLLAARGDPARAITLMVIPLSILWMVLSLVLGRLQQRLANEPGGSADGP
jgi:AAA family ATP:ADP antiporter